MKPLLRSLFHEVVAGSLQGKGVPRHLRGIQTEVAILLTNRPCSEAAQA